MRVSRLFLAQPLREGDRIHLDPDQSHYLRDVLRLKRGQGLTVFNGEGDEYAATVADLGRAGIALAIGERRIRDAESPLVTHLGLGIARGERMDLAIQKAVELGVTRITPLVTEHSVVRLDRARQEQRRLHWQKIAASACEQCGRNRVPPVEEPTALERWLPGRAGLRLFFDPHGAVGLGDLPRPTAGVCLLAGPEGGFAQRERVLARDAGFVAVRLGPRILRAETAVLAALAALQTLWGDWR
ncbi:16S rRNA (uracil(1498)-N(3))-methyltransferase [Candidatus Methylocalor cossyra]|uniref:Ribosomal RNA small subunit methyltransferase E n=1 Tax=Candidatus Methylocalor cossyra TaxID=3108543 RepID=A0ABM9NL14_9GAMM